MTINTVSTQAIDTLLSAIGNSKGTKTSSDGFAEVQTKALATGGSVNDASVQGADPVTDEERDFFQQLFPTAASELKAYQTYSPGGLHSLSVSGSTLDRKG